MRRGSLEKTKSTKLKQNEYIRVYEKQLDCLHLSRQMPVCITNRIIVIEMFTVDKVCANAIPGSDLDMNVLSAYEKQCTAEAQEVD